ncbi:hypothetical protein ACFSX9_15340 [Flavobacterium ardleyense]|uniref:Uncharacterized protein n=1 Tax=Flavobacterium ardleyense TaxID=2038737 RepID=A0ABW5ZD29_9FLAO
MKGTILVNKREINKAQIKKFLDEKDKSEAIKYLSLKGNVSLSTATYIVDLFKDNRIDNFDNQDLFDEQRRNLDHNQLIRKPSFIAKSRKVIVLFAILILSGFLFLKYFIGFSHVEHHFDHFVANSGFSFSSSTNEVLDAEMAQDVATDVALSAPTSPLDIEMWNHSIKTGQYIPEDVLVEIQEYKNRDFSKLVLAIDSPTDKEAQEAIINNYEEDVASLLQQYDANFKIGVCYKAPLQKNGQSGQVEIARVTAMVSAFNKERGNLGNIQYPLDVAYDFVKYQDAPNTWCVSQLSQHIPYDYILNKERW